MKRYTSKFLKTVALCYMAFPIVYLLFVALLFDVPVNQCVRILLSPSYYLLSLLAVVSGYGLWEMRRWAWYVFVPANIFAGYGNALIALEFSATHHKVLAFGISVLVLLAVLYRVRREVRVPYFLPRIRWWESNPRYKLSVPVMLKRNNGSVMNGDILDLSLSGCFVKSREDLGNDESLILEFRVFEHLVQCPGIVVWRTQSTVTHPKGVGIKFSPMGRHQRRVLRAVTQRLAEVSTLYGASRYLLSAEEFQRRLTELHTRKLKLAHSDVKQNTSAGPKTGAES